MYHRILLAVDLADDAETPKGLDEALDLRADDSVAFAGDNGHAAAFTGSLDLVSGSKMFSAKCLTTWTATPSPVRW